MKKIALLLLSVSILACTVINNEEIESGGVALGLEGEWNYQSGPSSCRKNGYIAFRRSGQYTRSSENCVIADDSFGKYRYGWYVASGYICFVHSKLGLKESMEKGYIKEICTWKVVESSATGFVFHEYKASGGYNVIQLSKI